VTVVWDKPIKVAASAFCKPSPAHCTSLSSQHIWPSGVFDRRSDGLELAAWRAQRSGVRFWQFKAVLQDDPVWSWL